MFLVNLQTIRSWDMKINVIFRLAKKEFFSYLNSPLAYTVIVPFLLLSVFIYIRNILVSGEASLRPYFDLLPWFLLFVAPTLSMKLLTEEKRFGTLELLLAHPISELEIVVGKFLGAIGFYVVILLTTVGLPVSLVVYSRPDMGQVFGQYFGALFIGGAFISIGVATSAYFKNAISSFLLGAAISFVFLILGSDLVTQLLPSPVNRLAIELSVLTRSQSFARGLLDIRDLFYFLTVTSIFLAIATIKLSERRTVEKPLEARKLKIALGLIVAIGFVFNVVLYSYPFKIDLTQDKLFTLSAGTKQTLKQLDDIVNVSFYVSRQLPPQMQLVARDVGDTLKDYERLSNNLKVKIVHPEESLENKNEARKAGINEVQFSSVSSGRFEAQTGFLGLSIRYGDKKESIPFVSDTSDLEYQLTRRIRKLVADKEKIVGLYKTGFSSNQILSEILSTQYKVQTLGAEDKEKTKELSTLIVIDDGSQENKISNLIKEYLNQEGKVLILASGVNVNTQMLFAQKSKSNFSDILSDYGVKINNDMVYDLQLSEILAFTDPNGQRYLSQYPYWLRALPASNDFTPLLTVKSISLGWPSSLSLEPREGIVQKVLLTTGVNAGKNDNLSLVSPQSLSSLKSNSEKVPLAVLIEKNGARLVVVGAHTLAEDQFLQNNPDNVAFLGGVVDYLVADKDLIAIPPKKSGQAVFEFKNQTDLLFVQYGNLLIPPLVVVLFAIVYLRRRRLLTRRIYEK